ncbi:DUF3168 domain-containing protein [Tropicimonas isoalkanivorans]|uniref:Gene transfer agent protein n=1 Tax=Tropicimonas isoalkanivorans TaxID=441112 RepID=A0A1I1EDZ4_9RHOB|nr:DUF3168 domain-containing protein [Tropicimonas isoalkanivorans]SFB83548.1 Protein of unknown function [Tropicimonas isoalkanivorans]
MSYGTSVALQAAIYQHLLADPALAALVGADIYDAVPSGLVPSLYVSLGPETVMPAGDKTAEGARHRFTVSVVSDGGGFLDAKAVAVAVSDALHGAKPALQRGTVVQMRFLKATAKRVGAGAKRRVDLRFEALVEDD